MHVLVHVINQFTHLLVIDIFITFDILQNLIQIIVHQLIKSYRSTLVTGQNSTAIFPALM